MFLVQEKALAPGIGISEDEIPSFAWFFAQVQQMKLPEEWHREWIEPGISVGYVNLKTGEKSLIHPNLNLLRSFFYERLNNDKATHTFQDKNRKLLPHIEDKLTKNMIGLNSKRKEAEKVNMMRDEQGKVVTSKTVRIAPDTSKLMTSRNYLLKGIVDKVVTKHELWGYGKRAKTYSQILEKSKKTGPAELAINEEPEQEETLQLVDKIYSEAAEYYNTEYGQLKKMPKKLEFEVYKLLTPEIVLRCMTQLGIQKQEIEHYWIALTMSCLYLPPLWRRVEGSLEKYTYEPKNIVFQAHPSLIYLVHQRSLFREFFNNLSSEVKKQYIGYRQISFLDYFERPFTVDMYAYMEQRQERTLNTMRDTEDEAKNQLNNSKLMRKSKLLQQEEERLLKLRNDWMLVEGTVASGVEQENYLLMEYVEGFWKSLKPDEQIWGASVSPYGEVVWSHNITGNSTNHCPYQSELRRHLQSHRYEIIPIRQTDDYKPDYGLFQGLAEFEANVINESYAEKMKFLEHYLVHHGDKKPYNIDTEKFEDYFNEVFSCPFDFDSQIIKKLQPEAGLPLWLEKVRAKRLKIISKKITKNTTDAQTIGKVYDLAKSIYIEATKLHQPDSLPTVMRSLAPQMDQAQLLRFLDYVFDIDQREMRLQRMTTEEGAKAEEEDDLFGSSQSQIEIDEESEHEPTVEDPDTIPEEEQIPYEQSEEENVNDQIENRLKKEDSRSSASQNILEETNLATVQQNQRQQSTGQNEEKEMDRKISKMKNVNIRVNKYSTSPVKKQLIKDSQKLIKEVATIKNDSWRLQTKKNLVLKNLRQHPANIKRNIIMMSNLPVNNDSPDKQNTKRPFHKKTIAGHTQQIDITNSLMPHQFNSTLGNQTYDNQSVVSFLDKLPKKVLSHRHSIPDESFSPQKHQQSMQSEQPSRKTEESVFELVQIIKDSIKDDPILKHINDVMLSQADQFNKTFLAHSISTQDSSMAMPHSILESPDKKRVRNQSLRSPGEFSTHYKEDPWLKGSSSTTKRPGQFTPILEYSGLKRGEQSQYRGDSAVSRFGRSTSSHNFKRGCMGNTVTHLLHTDRCVTSKVQFERLQVRKQLFLKNRGIRQMF